MVLRSILGPPKKSREQHAGLNRILTSMGQNDLSVAIWLQPYLGPKSGDVVLFLEVAKGPKE